MATKRPAYYGPYPAVWLELPDGQIVEVEYGHQLTEDIPASFRDSLLAQDDWREVTLPDKKDGDS